MIYFFKNDYLNWPQYPCYHWGIADGTSATIYTKDNNMDGEFSGESWEQDTKMSMGEFIDEFNELSVTEQRDLIDVLETVKKVARGDE